jgi:MFS family permease
VITASAAAAAAPPVTALPTEPPPARGSLWGPVPRFLAGRAVSNCGDWLTTIAVAVALYRLTGSLAAPAVAILLRVAPRPFGTLAGGHLADCAGPMPTLVTLNLGRAGTTALLALALDARAIPAVLVLLVISQGAGAAAQPAGQAAIPRLVPATSVGRTTAQVSVIDSLSLVVGPGIAAALLSLASGDWAWLVIVDAISFLVLAGVLAGLPSTGSPAPAVAPAPSRVWSGIGLVLGRPFPRQLALAQFGIFAGITALQAVLPAAAAARFGNPDAIGWVYAGVGAGNVLGGLCLLRTCRRGIGRRAMGTLTLLELLPLAAFALVGPAWVDIALVVMSGVASAPYEILAATQMARMMPAGRLGQASAAVWLFGYAGMLVGGLAAALLADRLGWSGLLLAVCAGGAAVLVAGWRTPRRAIVDATCEARR